ncbi:MULTISPECIES: IS3 family transposase [Xanthomonas]|nr:IS3 family transposase [Xanthomonas phaseoli]MBO9770044.1 IS3 family transposase [Xanthomonas phaseoli pv. dieffenbachiae]MBO9782189.1 IS3 family transposase [Xanthomonas phaseoli pv. dieffenbachiae]MBO9790006.1 IS3 family transposase [Xanthomonas phaseoli pv. dieffenbachiae]MBO9796137.1 IS3 family transposase [Xanthomonas phaseoli pv. dieffenbachiae]MBO9803387.1 IS3 family transposase [Xanthomonas phaseoli pv. dieffenbachiae]
MRTSKFTETQIVATLKQADAGVPVKDVCRQVGISTATYYQWKSKYGGLEASELRRVKELESENAKLKRMYAELALDNAAMKDLIGKKTLGPARKREAVRYLIEVHARPLRRSCACVGLARAAWYAPPLDWTVRDAELIAAIARVVEDRPSRGFWKCSDVLRRTRPDWNPKRIYRVYKAMRLNLRRAAKRRLPKRERVALYVPRLPDTVWSVDFMSDALACGRRFRTFNVVDDFNREVLHIEVDTSINSHRLVRVFEQIKHDHGLPQVVRSDNGPEFLGDAFTSWLKVNGVAIQYIQPGKPNQNAFIERFNRTFREEVLDQHLFTRLDDIREATHWWMIDYNEQRPHDALGGLTPTEYRNQHARRSTFGLSA